ncbi:MAG: hypothetical protein ACRCUJ_11780 [Phocaeicola sp.]
MKVLCRTVEETQQFLEMNSWEARPVYWKVTENGEFLIHEFYETEFEQQEGTNKRKMTLNEKPSMILRSKKDDNFPINSMSNILDLTENRYTGHRCFRDDHPF